VFPRPVRRGGPRPVPELRQVPRHHPPAVLPAPAPRSSRRRGKLPGRDLARPGHRGPAGPAPPGEPRPRRRHDRPSRPRPSRPYLRLFRHGVLAGLSEIRPLPRHEGRTAARPGSCWNACTTARTMSSGSCLTCGYRPHPTRPSATCARPRHSRKSPAGSAPKTPPRHRYAHPRLHLHRCQARHQHLHRPARRPHRKTPGLPPIPSQA